MLPCMKHHLLSLRDRLWDARTLDRYPRSAVMGARYLFVVMRDLFEGQLNMRAMSLVYTTLLSVVPLLALAFSVLKALGVHNSLEPVLLEFLRPLGDRGYELTASIIGFVEKIQVGVLGSLGVALLFYSAISLIQKVEESFNFIWRVERPRPLSQRLGEYFAVLTIGPVLVFSALGITASVMNSAVIQHLVEIEPFGLLVYIGSKLLPYLLIVGAFTFLYSFVPNTRVRIGPAAIGGLLAGVLWQSASLAFASFVAAATNYNAIYSGFAIVIFLLIWLYLGWLILMVGCLVAFYVQHPEHLQPSRAAAQLSGHQTEYLALMTMALAGQRFIDGTPGYTEDELSLALRAEPEHIARVTDTLLRHGLLIETGDDSMRLAPAIDLDSLKLSRIWRLARTGLNPRTTGSDPLSQEVLALLDRAEVGFEESVGDLSLRAWLIQHKPERTASPHRLDLASK